jgi:hypothetical protein
LGTTVKPIGRNEHDVDLVAHIAHVSAAVEPSIVKRAIGVRLRANGHYEPLVEEMPRCWRLNYANEFHLDITPSIPNLTCSNGGELVPDKTMKTWTRTNPKGYRALFERRAKLNPRLHIVEGRTRGLSADVEPYPTFRGFKGTLRRIIQILKRHRDHHFLNLDPCLAPISVILTTLGSRSYEYCVTRHTFDNEFDLLCEVVRRMPVFIEVRPNAGRTQWFIWNETTTGENFADKWNADPKRASAFWAWHTRALSDLENLANVEGLDRLTKSLRESFGPVPADAAVASLMSDVAAARSAGRLSMAPALGLTIGPSTTATAIRRNTFFGAA